MELYTFRSNTFIDGYILENFSYGVFISNLERVFDITDLLPDKFFDERGLRVVTNEVVMHGYCAYGDMEDYIIDISANKKSGVYLLLSGLVREYLRNEAINKLLV